MGAGLHARVCARLDELGGGFGELGGGFGGLGGGLGELGGGLGELAGGFGELTVRVVVPSAGVGRG